jgi:hypothetical protein
VLHKKTGSCANWRCPQKKYTILNKTFSAGERTLSFGEKFSLTTTKTFGGKSMNTWARRVLVGAVAIGCGVLSFWAVHQSEARKIERLAAQALCELELVPGAAKVTVPFTLRQAVDRLELGLRMGAEDERLFFAVLDGDRPIMQATFSKTSRFGGGRDIAAGTYTAVLRQETGSHGGYAVISDQAVTGGITGWQILSRVFVALTILSGVWAYLARKSANRWQRATSRQIFHTLLIPLVAMFMFLLFHEGGHALGQLAFGRFDLARSDFWGIHGSPHSGGKAGPSLAPWQQAVITGGGPLFPTFAGWMLFLLWHAPVVRTFRNVRPLLGLYYGAIMSLALLPFIAVAAHLCGIISDGETQSFISNSPGPLWVVKGLLWIMFLVNGCMLWRVLPELWGTWKKTFPPYRNTAHLNP